MKPVHVEIADEPLEKIEWTDKKTGEKRHKSKQRAYMHGAGLYPVPFKIELDDTSGPFRPGLYLIAGEAFSPGDFDGLKFQDRRMKLMPLEEALAGFTGKPAAKIAA